MFDRLRTPRGYGSTDQVTTTLHYGRAGRASSRRTVRFASPLGACAVILRGDRRGDRSRRCGCFSARPFFRGIPALLFALFLGPCAIAQYPGQIKVDKDKEAPSLRAIAVLEWTGDLAKPKTSRLVPITVFDGEQLQDAGVYMARPAPLAVTGGVEYILQKNGAKLGLFDVTSAGQEQDSWVGLGTWKPMPRPKLAAVAPKIDEDDARSDKPVLHRKNGSGSGSKSGSDSKSGDQDEDNQGSAPDPDRPTLHKKSGDDSSQTPTQAPAQTSGQPPAQPAGKSPSSTPSQTKKDDSGATQTTASSDPDRPALKRGKAKQEADEGYVSSVDNTDPDRPKLARGKSTVNGPDITPTLQGLPSDMTQAVAVSDPRNHPDHPWSYTWADPADELKMKAAMEDAARTALGLQTAAASTPAVKHTSTAKSGTAAKAGTATKAGTTARTSAAARAKAKSAHPPEPPPLADEEFRVFELAYGSGATMVLTAHTDAPPEQQKFVTLIAQPDLYGSMRLLFKKVTDAAHLDDNPRMRLVDAVDVLADNRGELVFELRGATQRQFALYRVARGTARQLFVTGGGATSIEASN
ncbi:MAG TPA: hypothetical protein VHZ28_06280 [Terracidiphilus sp.]|nr:hypothetical protein [Terracidiphilus sp.]